MTKETMQNIVDSIVLGELEIYFYITSKEVVNMFEPYCENSEDLDEVLEFIFNSKKYNYILLQNGDGYIFSKTYESSIRELFETVPINLNDQVWNVYVYKGNESMTLKELYEEVML